MKWLVLLGEGPGLFDLVVIDLLWWRNTQRIRFSFLPDKAIYGFVRDEVPFGYNVDDAIPASRVLADGYGQ